MNGIPVIKDFRMAITVKDLEDTVKSRELFPTHNNPFWPPEIHALSLLISNTQKTITEDIMTEESKAALTPFLNQDTMETIEELKKTYKSWDIYAVNQMWLSYLGDTDVPFINKYRELCSQHPQTKINELKQKIENIFLSVSKDEYRTFLSNHH